MRSVEGGGGVPQMLTFAHKGGRGGTVNDHSIMIVHWGGGGRSHNDHLITLMIFGQELQKRTNLYIFRFRFRFRFYSISVTLLHGFIQKTIICLIEGYFQKTFLTKTEIHQSNFLCIKNPSSSNR